MIPRPERIAFGWLYRTLPQPERENAKRGTSARPWKQISSQTAHLRRDDEGTFHNAVTGTGRPAIAAGSHNHDSPLHPAITITSSGKHLFAEANAPPD